MSRPDLSSTAPVAVTRPLEFVPTCAASLAVPAVPPLPAFEPPAADPEPEPEPEPELEPPEPEFPAPAPPPGGIPPGAISPPIRTLRADSTRTSCPPISSEPPNDRSCPAATRSAPCVCTAACAATLTLPAAFTSIEPPAPTAPVIAALRPAASATLSAACAAPSTDTSRPDARRRSRAACTAALGAMRTSPDALTSRSPVSATRLPPTFTPTPASVPISRMLLAYMPPNAAVSSATTGAGPSPVPAVALPLA
ncbi:hypothetical protein LMG26685_05205 [Achromobacter mucicolens]|nr:hypothetical protein LMG26685_05205 [Achromobacter mucicolens]